MKTLPGALIVCLAGTACAFPQRPQGAPTVDGFVTRVMSPSDFSVNGIRVVCGPETQTYRSDDKSAAGGCPAEMPFIGQEMTIFGRLDPKNSVAAAERIELQVPASEEVSGAAVVEAVADSATAAASPELYADGYRIQLAPGAAMEFDPSLRSLASVKAGTWIEYKAHLRPDGVLVTTSASFHQRPEGDDGKRSSSDVNHRRLPSWPDTMMQQRVREIAEKLIPAYERELPEDDPARISFRFDVVDSRSMGTDPIPLPDGLVLLTRQDVQQMQNDSQLAALLADSIACILERQTWRLRIAANAAASGDSILHATEAFLGKAKQAGFSGSANEMRDVLGREYAQSARVGLELMHEAGFDIEQAPIAWWMLANHDRQLTATTLPYRSATLYRVLGTLWDNPAVDRRGGSTGAGNGPAAEQ